MDAVTYTSEMKTVCSRGGDLAALSRPASHAEREDAEGLVGVGGIGARGFRAFPYS
jgi:hypothetical protein